MWFDKIFTRFECARYTANRIVSIRIPSVVKTNGKTDREFHWMRGLRASNPDHIKYLDDIFSPGYDMYVTGFTFAWDRFLKEHGPLPSSADRGSYYQWVQKTIVPNLGEFINTKDLVFEIDRHEGHGLKVAGSYAIRIRDSLRSLGINDIHFLFSGKGGYHVIVEDAERFYKILQAVPTGRTPESLSWASIESAKNFLDDSFPKETFRDQGSRGRSYEDVDIHFSPMYPQGVRKAAYSLTSNGTVALPVGEKEMTEVDDIQYYTPLKVLKNYAIKGRGWKL